MVVEYIDACSAVAVALSGAVATQWRYTGKREEFHSAQSTKQTEAHIADLRKSRETTATHSSDFENRMSRLENPDD